MSILDSLILRVVGPLRPSWRAWLMWARAFPHDSAGKAIVEAVVKRGDIAIDVGASLGLYTDRLARLVGPEGTVYAFEPHPDCTAALARIASTHGNVTFVVAALSDHSGTSKLLVPVARGRRITALGSLEGRPDGPRSEIVEVATTTLGSEVGDVPHVRFMKCDVEGHEHEVLLGAQEWLSRAKPVLLMEIEQRHRERAISETFDLLRGMGYDGYMLTSQGPRPLVEFDVEKHQLALIADVAPTWLPPRGYVNDFLFVPSGTPVPVPLA